MKTNLATNFKAGRTVPCAPQSAEDILLRKDGAHGVTRPTCFALFCAAALFTHAAFAGKSALPPPPPPPPSSGTVVLDLDYLHPDGAFAENFGLTVTPSGAIYASGAADVDNNNQWNSWSTVDDFLSGGGNAEARRFDVASNGDLYAAGYMDGQNILRTRAAGTATWVIVDVYPFEAHGIAANATGNLFLGGGNASTWDWMIRKY